MAKSGPGALDPSLEFGEGPAVESERRLEPSRHRGLHPSVTARPQQQMPDPDCTAANPSPGPQ